jgi:hypothetical protein
MDRQIGSHIRVTTSSCERIRDATPFLPTVSFRFRQVWRTAEFARPAHFCGPGRDRLRSWSEYLLRRRMDFGSHGPQDLAGENRGIRADCFFSRARFFRPHHARTGRPFQRFVESATVASVNPAPNVPRLKESLTSEGRPLDPSRLRDRPTGAIQVSTLPGNCRQSPGEQTASNPTLVPGVVEVVSVDRGFVWDALQCSCGPVGIAMLGRRCGGAVPH